VVGRAKDGKIDVVLTRKRADGAFIVACVRYMTASVLIVSSFMFPIKRPEHVDTSMFVGFRM
jgi:hypothetical protein